MGNKNSAMIVTSGEYEYKGLSAAFVEGIYRDIDDRARLEHGAVTTVEWIRRKEPAQISVGDCWIERRYSNGKWAAIRKTFTHVLERSENQPFGLRLTLEFLNEGAHSARNPKFHGTFSCTVEDDGNNNCVVRWYNAFVPVGPFAHFLSTAMNKPFEKLCYDEITEDFRAMYVHCLKKAIDQDDNGNADKEALQSYLEAEQAKPWRNKREQSRRESKILDEDQSPQKKKSKSLWKRLGKTIEKPGCDRTRRVTDSSFNDSLSIESPQQAPELNDSRSILAT